MIPVPAMSITVNRQRKIKKVVCTEPVSRLEIAAVVGNISWIAQG